MLKNIHFMKTIRHIRLYTITFVLVMSSFPSLSKEYVSSKEVVVRLTDVQVGFIYPKYRHRVGTYLEQYYDKKEITLSKYFEVKRNVAIGAKFKINSNLGKKLQIASVVTASSPDSGVKSKRYVTLDTVNNGDIFNHWQHVKSMRDRRFSQWHFQFLLIAIDQDIALRAEEVGNLGDAIKIYETTIFVKKPKLMSDI